MGLVDMSIAEQIEVKMIRPSQLAVRDKFQKMNCKEDNTLINSIREHGLLQPIIVRPFANGFEIVAGHRRYQACKSLRWRFIPCKIHEMTDKQAYEIQLIENIQRKSMDPIEEAEAFRRYIMDFGWGGISELARKISKSEEYISHRIQLLKLPDDIKGNLITNRINVSQALELTDIHPDKQVEIISHILHKNLTVRQIRELKSILKGEDDISEFKSGPSEGISKPVRIVKVTKKTSLALKVTLTRLDNLIDEVHMTIEPEQRPELINFLMELRLKVHGMIDETIRFRNASLKSTTKN
jgi:ParB family transcriptional regulator, chromosome partitioning protein